MDTFLNGNLFQTIIIFVVGLFTFGVYLWQKNDKKKLIASTLMMEIRDIENRISSIKNVELTFLSIYDSKPVYSENYWSKNKQLFIKDFNQDEFKLINDFYDYAFRIEEERQILRNQILILLQEKQRSLSSNVCQIAKDLSAKESIPMLPVNQAIQTEFLNKINMMFQLINMETPSFIGILPMNLIKTLSKDVPLVSTSSVGNKLNKIGRIK